MDLLPERTKKPRLQKKPDRKELKGKVPTQSMYRNYKQDMCQHVHGETSQYLFNIEPQCIHDCF